jgi:site-specific recombinase XerD
MQGGACRSTPLVVGLRGRSASHNSVAAMTLLVSGRSREEEAVVMDQSRIAGPLARYRVGFGEELVALGYTPGSAKLQRGLMSHASRWLASQGLTAGQFGPDRVAEFLEARRTGGYASRVSQRGLTPLLGYLRGLGVVPAPAGPAVDTPLERLVAVFREYLVSERGLADGTVNRYLAVARAFLLDFERPDALDLQRLTAADVTSFVVRECRGRWHVSATTLVTGLRSLLRFLLLAGYTDHQLAQAVPTATVWAAASLPRPLTSDVIVAMLAACDEHTVVGARDLAILTLLHRLGLRAGEVAGLELADIDWRHGEFVVCGKANRRERLPLPADVGQVVVAYLHVRPRVECRAVFLTARAPIVGVSRDVVGQLVRAACRRAGLPEVGPHRLRHSAATATLAGGASLAEVGQLLRQRSAAATAIYAKVDRTALRTLALPWPGGAA